MEIPELMAGLTDKNEQKAYACFNELMSESERSPIVYPFFDRFAEMLGSANSFVRTRGLVLIAANAKWDADYKIDEIIDSYLTHITDEKPITARQCIKALPTLAKYKQDLLPEIVKALTYANPSRYRDSMRPLVQKDIQKALEEIHKLSERA